MKSSSPFAHTLAARKAHLPIKFHAENTPALPVTRKDQSGKVLLCPQQDNPATSVANFCTAVLKGWRDHTSPAQERANLVMDEVMSGRMSQADGMVEMAKAQEMMREEARARTTHPEHRWED